MKLLLLTRNRLQWLVKVLNNDIYKRAKAVVPGLKKKGSVRTVSGGSTGLVQQKVKKW